MKNTQKLKGNLYLALNLWQAFLHGVNLVIINKEEI